MSHRLSRPTSRSKIRLGVNIDHVATLRQLRAGTVDYPDIIAAREAAIRGGADQITVHLRGDRRHIQVEDLEALSKDRGVLLNLEMAANEDMTAMAVRFRPDIVCLVPEKREEVTTEGGLDVIKNQDAVRKCINACHAENIRVSLFIDPLAEQIKMAQTLDADAVEFHTGKYALARGRERDAEEKGMDSAFQAAYQAGLAVHAGHGLDYVNVIPLLKNDFLQELNIGHSIVCRAVMTGLERAVAEMKQIIERETGT
jgi:pyridoxine 5-phosphate synthase